MATECESSNWTRDAYNPVVLQSDSLTGRGTHPIQQFRKRIHSPLCSLSVLIRSIRTIRVTMLLVDARSGVCCTHQLKLIGRPSEDSVTVIRRHGILPESCEPWSSRCLR